MASMRGGSWPASTRRRSCSWETLERIQFCDNPIRDNSVLLPNPLHLVIKR
jgi:hypothetical protein